MDKLTYLASTNPMFIKALQHELHSLGIRNSSLLKQQGLNFIKFETDQSSLWKIMLQSRLIESLKVQIAQNIKVE